MKASLDTKPTNTETKQQDPAIPSSPVLSSDLSAIREGVSVWIDSGHAIPQDLEQSPERLAQWFLNHQRPAYENEIGNRLGMDGRIREANERQKLLKSNIINFLRLKREDRDFIRVMRKRKLFWNGEQMNLFRMLANVYLCTPDDQQNQQQSQIDQNNFPY